MRRRRRPDFSRLLRTARTAADGRVRLGSRQIYILPTFRGWLFAALLLALLLAAINYSNNLIFALTFLLAGIGHAALLTTWRNLAGLQLTISAADPVFAGATAHFPAMLDAGRTSRDAIRLSFRAQPGAVGDVPLERPVRIDVPFSTRRRGMLLPGQLRVWTEFPLGLFHAWSLVETASRSLVYPAPVPGFPLPVGGGAVGDVRDDGIQGADDFAGLREYQPGDSLSRISWKTSARTDALHAKEFYDEISPVRWLEWDSVPLADAEQRLGVMTSWVIEAADKGESWGMRLPGETLLPDTGPGHKERCLASLACFGMNA